MVALFIYLLALVCWLGGMISFVLFTAMLFSRLPVAEAGKVVSAGLNFALVDIHTPHGAKVVRRSASWISGYFSKECWDQKRHGWVDPQKFFKEHENGTMNDE